MGLMLTVVPYVYYRQGWAHSKRLRVMTEGKMYRSGCLTAQGFRDAVQRFGIRTIINLRDEAPNPELPRTYFDRRHTIKEQELCRELGVKFVFIEVDLVQRDELPREKPKALEDYLKILDDPASYPVLIHCQAGLHRTGVLAAVYRMEYEGWTAEQAMRELRDNGFGVWNATSANDYVAEYVLGYHPRHRHANAEGVPGRFIAHPADDLGPPVCSNEQLYIRPRTKTPTDVIYLDGKDDVIPVSGVDMCPTYEPVVRSIRSVYVPTCNNKTEIRGLEFDMAKALIREIQNKTPCQVVDSRDGADSELICTILREEWAWVIGSAAGASGRKRRDIETIWRDLRPGRVGQLLKQTSSSEVADRKGNDSRSPIVFAATTTYVANYGESDLAAEQTLTNDLARQVVSMMEAQRMFRTAGVPKP